MLDTEHISYAEDQSINNEMLDVEFLTWKTVSMIGPRLITEKARYNSFLLAMEFILHVTIKKHTHIHTHILIHEPLIEKRDLTTVATHAM